jgi:hypothetical protein
MWEAAIFLGPLLASAQTAGWQIFPLAWFKTHQGILSSTEREQH